MKKYQVNLPIWMTDHLEKKAEEFGVSMSEFLRFHVCMSLICSAREMCADFESSVVSKVAKLCSPSEIERAEERERFMEDILFEAQRAVKHRTIKEYGKYPLL